MNNLLETLNNIIKQSDFTFDVRRRMKAPVKLLVEYFDEIPTKQEFIEIYTDEFYDYLIERYTYSHGTAIYYISLIKKLLNNIDSTTIKRINQSLKTEKDYIPDQANFKAPTYIEGNLKFTRPNGEVRQVQFRIPTDMTDVEKEQLSNFFNRE